MTELHEKLAELLMLVWKGIAGDYKSRYRKNIWQQFENQVRSAAYTNDFNRFISTLLFKMNAELGTNTAERSRALEIIAELSGREREALRLLRQDTQLIVTMVRVANDKRRAAWMQSEEAER